MGRPAPRRRRSLAVVAGLLVALVALYAAARPADNVEPVPPGARVPATSWAKPVGSAITVDPLRSDAAYRRAFFSTFASATPENELKWEVVEPRRGDFAFARADALIAAARSAGARVRGHPLVWDLQLPGWVTKADPDELESILLSHVETLALRYRGRIDQWDVVNEPLEENGSMTNNVFFNAMGERYIDLAFDAARRADPDAKRFLNEISAERGPKAEALVALVRRLRGRGVPIDGVGIQNHTTARGFPTRAELSRLFTQLEPLDVEITEMDVVIERPGDDPGPAWRAAAEACADAPNCTGLTVWGVTDAYSWKGVEQAATLFDAAGREKPGLDAVRAALRR